MVEQPNNTAGILESREPTDVARIETCYRLARQHGANRDILEVTQKTGQQLPFNANCFDTLIVLPELGQLRWPQMLLWEARRVLRPGGRLLLATANAEWPGYKPASGAAANYSAQALAKLLVHSGFFPKLYGALPTASGSLRSRTGAVARKIGLQLIPTRKPTAAVLPTDPQAALAVASVQALELTELCGDPAERRFQALYALAVVDKWPSRESVAA